MNTQSPLLLDFQNFVQQIVDQWRIPGLSIAVVKDDQVLLRRGFGFRNLASQMPVTENTLFPIASCTKAFTSLAMGMLVDEGLIDWDRPVCEYLPDFRLYDEYATQRLTPRDLLCHRSGLPGHDILWYASDFSREEVYRRLRYLEPTCDLRAKFQYQNMMYLVAGLLIERTCGQTWTSFVRDRIFTPLGMRRSGFSTALLQQDPDHSRPYFLWDGEIMEIPFREADGENSATAAAGGIVSCAVDMAQWLRLQLHGGCLGDTRLISPESFYQLQTPHIFLDDPSARERYGVEFNSAGLGWFLRMQKGQVLVSHDGIADGFASFVVLAPRRNLGVALLSNLDFSRTNFSYPLGIIANTLFDRLLDLEPTDWARSEKEYYDSLTRPAAPALSVETVEPITASIPSLEPYEGEYEHPGYGIVAVQKSGQGLTVTLNRKLEFPLKHKRNDVFEVADDRFGTREEVCFASDSQGNISSLSVRMEPAVKAAVFIRVPR